MLPRGACASEQVRASKGWCRLGDVLDPVTGGYMSWRTPKTGRSAAADRFPTNAVATVCPPEHPRRPTSAIIAIADNGSDQKIC